MSLRANLTRQSQCINYSLLLMFDLPQCNPSFEAHLQIVAEYLDNLFISYLKAKMLVSFLVEPGFTLNYYDDFFLSKYYWMC